MRYEVEYWELEFSGKEDMGYDIKYTIVQADSEKEAIEKAKDENRRGKDFKIYKKFKR